MNNLPDGFYFGSNTFVDFDIHDNEETIVEFVALEALDAVPDGSGVLRLFPKVGDIFNVRIRILPPNKKLQTCSYYTASGHLDNVDSDRCFSLSSSVHVELDEHPRGTGGIVSVSSRRISDSELEFDVTAKKAGFYSMWIAETLDGTVFSDVRRISFQVSE